MNFFSKNYGKLAILVPAMALSFSSCSGNGGSSGESGDSSSSAAVGNGSSSSFEEAVGCSGDEDSSETEYCSNGTKKTYGSVTHEGQDYKTIAIGARTWMAENMDYEAIGSVCYDNNTANCAKYGKLYDWATAMALPSKCNSVLSESDIDCAIETPHQGICPDEWHIPNNTDWGPALSWIKCSFSSSGYSCSDIYGFNALLGGSGSKSDFSGEGNFGNWWSATEETADYAHFFFVESNSSPPLLYADGKSFLLSVRCIKD
ncbi:MAG: hypothetical protein LBH25_04000 [Fibromonadaceae bacterium]|jgi:uncharacterized protein (TIGR02145 family)|nr:hypothetical protein [Fibromonadaceae bacterium]